MKELGVLEMVVERNSKTRQQECGHVAFVNNACAGCKKPKSKCNNPAVLQLRHVGRNVSLTAEGIRRIRDLNLKSLLHRKKLQLVLDLDNTLIHAIKADKKVAQNNNKNKNTNTNTNDVFEILKGETLVKLRPGARDFLEKASKSFDLSIYTMADEAYARQIANILEAGSDNVRFTSVISREDCTKMCTKGLDVVLSHPRLVLIVDDLDDVWSLQDRANLVKIHPYTFFQKGGSSHDDDQHLATILALLLEVHSMFYHHNNSNSKDAHHPTTKDVRPLLNKVIMDMDGPDE